MRKPNYQTLVSSILVASMALGSYAAITATVSGDGMLRREMQSRMNKSSIHDRKLNGNHERKLVMPPSPGQDQLLRNNHNSLVLNFDNKNTNLKAPFHSTQNAGKLYGNIVYELSWVSTQVAQYRISEFDLANGGAMTTVGTGPNSNAGGVYFEDNYLAVRQNTYANLILSEYFTLWDATDWSQTWDKPLPTMDFNSTDMGYDPKSGNVYGCFATADSWYFGTVNPDNLEVSLISEIGETPWFGVTCDNAGQIYAIDGDGALFKVDKLTGATTLVGNSGVKTQYTCGAAFNPADGKIYYTPNSQDFSQLWAINPTDASASKICDIPDMAQVRGLYFGAKIAEDNAPSAPENITVGFQPNAMSGTISFKVPTTLYNGTTGSGDVSYAVFDNGKEIACAQTTYGAEVEISHTLAKAGMHSITVSLSNSTGTSPFARYYGYLGPDKPLNPGNINLSYADGKFTLTWDAPTKGTHDIDINPESLSYKIVAYPGERVVASDYKGSSFTENVTEPEDLIVYYYTIETFNNGVSSGSVMSNSLTLGALTPECTYSLDTQANFNACTVIDGSSDGKTWEWREDKECARCQYDNTNPKDEWLILPQMKMEAGKAYLVSFVVGCESPSYREILEMRAGMAPTSQAMTKNVISPFVVNKRWSYGGMEVEAYFTPDQTGIWHLGLHATSAAKMYWIWIKDIKVAAGVNSLAPTAVTGISAVSDPTGALKSTLTFTVPSKNLAGTELDPVTKIEILRDDELIGVLDSPAPANGSVASYIDNSATHGNNVYTIVAYNRYGRGIEAKHTQFVGYDVPAQVVNVRATKDASTGLVNLKWDPVTEDVNGLVFPEGYVKYQILFVDGSQRQLLDDYVDGTEANINVHTDEGTQSMIYFGVFAVTEDGQGEGSASNYLCIGTPYQLPVHVRNVGGNLNTLWGIDDLVEGASWYYISDIIEEELGGDADGDEYAFMFYGEEEDASSQLVSGMIDIPANAVKPVIRFSDFVYESENILEVMVSTDGLTFSPIFQTSPYDDAVTWGEDEGWFERDIDISAFKGKTIRIAFRGTLVDAEYIFIDKISVLDIKNDELTEVLLSAPNMVEGGSEIPMNVSLANRGLNSAENYTVDLLRDGQVIETIPGVALEPEQTATLKLSDTTMPEAGKNYKYQARVNYTADQDQTNNVSAEIEVNVLSPALPIISDLTAEIKDEGVELTWTEPGQDIKPRKLTVEDFENYTPWWPNTPGEWTVVKSDNGTNGGFQGIDIPGLTLGESKAPFFLFDSSMEGLNKTFAASSGTKYMAAMFNYDGSAIDSWLISPELPGNAQIITFMARSYTSSYPESFAVACSTTGTNPEDFETIKGSGVKRVPQTWGLYSVQVPEGTKYVAIHATTSDGFMLMIDDFAMQLASSPEISLELKGYNIYRDGAKLNDYPITDTRFVDSEAALGKHIYEVTAVYKNGESAMSNKAEINLSGISAVSIDGASIRGEKGCLVITNAVDRKVMVAGTDGVVLRSGICTEPELIIHASTGVYTVSINGKTVKVFVK